MGVYIKGMEMPESCDDCEFCKRDISGYDWCHVPMMNGRDKPLDEPVIKPDWCPLIPVLPHGRLIDADEFLKKIKPDREEDNHSACTFAVVKDLMRKHIKRATTIIPAEEEATTGPYDLLYEEGGYNSNGV